MENTVSGMSKKGVVIEGQTGDKRLIQSKPVF